MPAWRILSAPDRPSRRQAPENGTPDLPGAEQAAAVEPSAIAPADLSAALPAPELATAHATAAFHSVPGSELTVAEQLFGEIGPQVEVARRDGQIDLRMRLDPPGLGTVHVRLTAGEQSLQAQLIVPDESARAAIESQWSTLRDSLSGLGVTLQDMPMDHDQGGRRGQPDWDHPDPSDNRFTARPRRSPLSSLERVARRRTGTIDIVA